MSRSSAAAACQALPAPVGRRSGRGDRGLAEAAASRSVIIEPGDRFFDRSEKPSRFMRLGISSISLQ
ncbi:PLP-dependent aminotransferase family protein, partial [Mesorhizobium sp. M2D.F.Ca.ET.171.01.1.1]